MSIKMFIISIFCVVYFNGIFYICKCNKERLLSGACLDIIFK